MLTFHFVPGASGAVGHLGVRQHGPRWSLDAWIGSASSTAEKLFSDVTIVTQENMFGIPPLAFWQQESRVIGDELSSGGELKAASDEHEARCGLRGASVSSVSSVVKIRNVLDHGFHGFHG